MMIKKIFRYIGIVLIILIVFSLLNYLFASQFFTVDPLDLADNAPPDFDYDELLNIRRFLTNTMTFLNVAKWICLIITTLYVFFKRVKKAIIIGAFSSAFLISSFIFQYIIWIIIVMEKYSVDVIHKPSSVINNFFKISVTYQSLFLVSMIILTIFILLFALLIYIKVKLRFEESSRSFLMEKLKKLFLISDKIKLEMLQEVMKIDIEKFNNKVVKIAEQFGAEIDGNYLIVNKGTLNDFLESLDDQFKEWEELEKKKVKKI